MRSSIGIAVISLAVACSSETLSTSGDAVELDDGGTTDTGLSTSEDAGVEDLHSFDTGTPEPFAISSVAPDPTEPLSSLRPTIEITFNSPLNPLSADIFQLTTIAAGSGGSRQIQANLSADQTELTFNIILSPGTLRAVIDLSEVRDQDGRRLSDDPLLTTLEELAYDVDA